MKNMNAQVLMENKKEQMIIYVEGLHGRLIEEVTFEPGEVISKIDYRKEGCSS